MAGIRERAFASALRTVVDATVPAEPLRARASVVAVASTPDGQGFWRVTATGDVLGAGDARSYGGTEKLARSHPIVGIAGTPDGHGYWLAAADGGVFTFGDATFHGSAGNIALRAPVVGVAATGRGYMLLAADGGVLTFGDATFYGSAAGSCPDTAVRRQRPGGCTRCG